MRKICVLILALAACGGDGDEVEPAIIVGGGVHDPGIDGKVHVYVVDEDTDAPLTGATVRVGTVEGQTDAAGLFTAEGDLIGKQTIVAKATNYAASVWVGANGANVTIPMTKVTTTVTTPAQAELSGTVAGWDQLALPLANHATVAFVTYSQSKDLGDDDGNDLPLPATDSNLCLQGPGPRTPCTWRINARAGTIAVAAGIGDYDSKGTASEDDDELTISNFAIKMPITVADGADQSGIVLDRLPDGSTTTASVSFGTPPSAFTDVAAVVGVDLGDHGVLRIGQVAPTLTSVTVPSLSAIAGATGYELLGLAAEPGTSGTEGQSIVLRRGISSPSGIAAGDWMAPPGGLASDRAMVSFTASAGAFAHTLEIDTNPATGTGSRAMSVISLDGTTTIELPVDFAPLPSGPLLVRANAFDAGTGFDVEDFEVETLLESIQRLAGETIELN